MLAAPKRGREMRAGRGSAGGARPVAWGLVRGNRVPKDAWTVVRKTRMVAGTAAQAVALLQAAKAANVRLCRPTYSPMSESRLPRVH